MSLGRIVAGFFLTGLAIVVTYSFATYYFESRRRIEPVEQVYAGEPISENWQTKPALYSCRNESEGIFMVVSPTSGEFMLFDSGGAWINNGTFFHAKTDKGIEYNHAEIGNTLLAFFPDDNHKWRLAVATGEKVVELFCN